MGDLVISGAGWCIPQAGWMPLAMWLLDGQIRACADKGALRPQNSLDAIITLGCIATRYRRLA
ncbi:hypothetical protein V1279_005670 [Bradyrhizobium sp. AZCC 1610]|uniref:hypothetical protein n=1 Tax=Bradyrhizobium sp. AZCC 1610 TaxID=3117020 RepID=UPI002FF15A25